MTQRMPDCTCQTLKAAEDESESRIAGGRPLVYSRSAVLWMLVILVISAISISSIVPPFQSPDEYNHVKRAYLLAKGEVFLGSENHQTGGPIDEGLLKYMQLFSGLSFNYEEKMSARLQRESRRIAWSGTERFSDLPNIAVYMPLSYVPQAAALFLGLHLGWSVSDSYYLARGFALLACVAMLGWALLLYPVPLPVLSLLVLPMALFQFASASLDGISFSMSVLAACLFMRAADLRFEFNVRMHIALIVCLFLLVTSRTNLVALVWLPAVIYWIRSSRTYLFSTGALAILSVAWILFATLTVEGAQIHESSPIEILAYYLRHVGEFCSVLISTVTSRPILLGYWYMFIGILGWLDTPLDLDSYVFFAILIACLGLVSMSNTRELMLPRMALLAGAVASIVLLFVLFLATYTLLPARFVEAVQGRYFYPAAIFSGFAVFHGSVGYWRSRLAMCALVLMLLLSLGSTIPKLLARYWMS